MVAPLPETGEEATCSLWFLAMDPADPARNVGVKISFPASRAVGAQREPFRLRVGDAWLSDHGHAAGSIEQDGRALRWELRWEPRLPAYGHVHPVLRAARIAKTVLFLPHPDLEIARLDRRGTAGGSTCAARAAARRTCGAPSTRTRWAWAHCNDFTGADGEPRDRTRSSTA